MRCDKIAFFTRTRELFSKKLLYFSVKSVILYPTGASVGYKAKRRAFLSGTPVVHPSIIMLFSSFTFLSFTLPVPQGTRKAMTHLHGSSLFLLSAAALWAGTRLNALRYALGMPMILILRPSSVRLLLRSPSTPPTVCMFCRSAWRCEFAESRLIQPTYSTKRQGFLIAGDLAVL